MNHRLLILALLVAAACNQAPSSEEQDTPVATQEVESKVQHQTIEFQTQDEVKVFGDLYTVDSQALTLLLFHQAGTNGRGEYQPIIPRLLDWGYNVLSIDQRVGGQLFGQANRTAMNIPGASEFEYCEAYPDLVGALAFIQHRGFTGPLVAWGSSYSAALSIRLGVEHAADLAGVVAFSPASGSAMEGCKPEPYIEQIEIPLMVFRPGSEAAAETVKEQLALVKTEGHQSYVAPDGVHGSSMLVQERAKSNVTATWKALRQFLQAREAEM